MNCKKCGNDKARPNGYCLSCDWGRLGSDVDY